MSSQWHFIDFRKQPAMADYLLSFSLDVNCIVEDPMPLLPEEEAEMRAIITDLVARYGPDLGMVKRSEWVKIGLNDE